MLIRILAIIWPSLYYNITVELVSKILSYSLNAIPSYNSLSVHVSAYFAPHICLLHPAIYIIILYTPAVCHPYLARDRPRIELVQNHVFTIGIHCFYLKNTTPSWLFYYLFFTRHSYSSFSPYWYRCFFYFILSQRHSWRSRTICIKWTTHFSTFNNYFVW